MPSDWDPRYRLGRRLTDAEAYELGRRMAQQHRTWPRSGAATVLEPGANRVGFGAILSALGALLVLGTIVAAVFDPLGADPTGAFILGILFAGGGLLMVLSGIRAKASTRRPLNAAFHLFQRRAKGGVLLSATFAFIVLATTAIGVFALVNAQGLADYFSWSLERSSPTATTTPPASVAAMTPSFLVLLFVLSVLFAAFEAACLRWMVLEETGGLLGLSIGPATFRVWAGYWVWAFVLLVLMLPSAIPASVVPSPGVSLALQGLVFVGCLYVLVRLAPAAATTIAQRRFSFFTAWKATRARVAELLGAHVLQFLVFCLVAPLAAFVTFIVVAASFGWASPNDAGPVQRMVGQTSLLPTNAVVMLVFAVASFGVNARAALAAREDGALSGSTPATADSAISSPTSETMPPRREKRSPPNPDSAEPPNTRPAPASDKSAAPTVKRLVVFLANHRPNDEPWYIRQLLPAIGLSLPDLEGAQIDFQYVSSDKLNAAYISGFAMAAGHTLDKCVMIPFNDADGGHGQVLKVLA